MPVSARIDAVKVAPSGVVNVEYTAGAGPLPGPGGTSIEFPNMQALYHAIADAESNISEQQLVLMALATWVKVDPQMTTLALARNKTAAIDFTGTAQAVKLG